MAVLVRRLGSINAEEKSDLLVDGSYWETEENGTLLVFDGEGTPIAEYRQYKWDSAIVVITQQDVVQATVDLLLDTLDELLIAEYDAAEEAAYAEKAERERVEAAKEEVNA